METNRPETKVTLETDEGGYNMTIVLSNPEGLTIADTLHGLLSMYAKVAEDHGVEMIKYFCEYTGVPYHIEEAESHLQ